MQAQMVDAASPVTDDIATVPAEARSTPPKSAGQLCLKRAASTCGIWSGGFAARGDDRWGVHQGLLFTLGLVVPAWNNPQF
jgi:hypothetical protein